MANEDGKKINVLENEKEKCYESCLVMFQKYKIRRAKCKTGQNSKGGNTKYVFHYLIMEERFSDFF